MNLINEIKNKNVTVGVIGLGYVGLPLAVEFASKGFKVIGFEVSQEKADAINQGQSHVEDISNEELTAAQNTGGIEATVDFSKIKDVDCISICVPTPLVKTRDPDMSYIVAACTEIEKYLTADTLIVLESTTYPGTTEEILVPMVKRAGFEVGKDVFVAFSPERIDPGNQHYDVSNTPKVVGGITSNCLEAASALYEPVVGSIVPVSSANAAEMVKLLENTFRSVNIGLANEFAQMCHILHLDSNEIIEAAATKPFGFTPFYPGPGLGGHCIPIDPHYLSWKLKTLNYQTRFIDLASQINTEMPEFVVNLAADRLNDQAKSVKKSKVLVIGAAYKKNISDMRESPSLDIIRLLVEKGADVVYHDAHVPQIQLNGSFQESQTLTDDLLKSQDLVIIATWHDGLSIDQVMEHSKSIIDTRNATKGITNNPKVFRI